MSVGLSCDGLVLGSRPGYQSEALANTQILTNIGNWLTRKWSPNRFTKFQSGRSCGIKTDINVSFYLYSKKVAANRKWSLNLNFTYKIIRTGSTELYLKVVTEQSGYKYYKHVMP